MNAGGHGTRLANLNHRVRGEAGHVLVEALVASAVVIALAAGVAQVAAMSAASVRAGAAQGTAFFLATQKLEQLASLAWTYDALLQPVSDVTADLSLDPPAPTGRGLLPSGPIGGAVAGYIDYVDRDGAWIGSGPGPPAGTAFVRHWSVSPVPSAGPDALLLQVAVTAASLRGGAGGTTVRPGDPGVTWLATVRVRE